MESLFFTSSEFWRWLQCLLIGGHHDVDQKGGWFDPSIENGIIIRRTKRTLNTHFDVTLIDRVFPIIVLVFNRRKVFGVALHYFYAHN